MDPMIGVLLIIVGVLLLLHHGWKHHFEPEPSTARQESCACVCYFQPKDIEHFESWSVVSLVNAFLCVLDPVFDEFHAVLAVFFYILAVLLLFLSCFKCSDSKMFSCCVLHNICNHETWIVSCFTGAVTVLVLL
jgi:hypothetical protein